jgi:hypothetical protein
MVLFPGRVEWEAARRDAGLATSGHDDMHAGELETSLLLHAYPARATDVYGSGSPGSPSSAASDPWTHRVHRDRSHRPAVARQRRKGQAGPQLPGCRFRQPPGCPYRQLAARRPGRPCGGRAASDTPSPRSRVEGVRGMMVGSQRPSRPGVLMSVSRPRLLAEHLCPLTIRNRASTHVLKPQRPPTRHPPIQRLRTSARDSIFHSRP